MKRPRLVLQATTAVALALAGCSGSINGDQGSGEAGGSGGDGAGGDGAGGDSGGNAGGAGGTVLPDVCKAPSAGAARWRRLTVAQYAATVKDLLGTAPTTTSFLPDTRTDAFTTNALVPPQEVDIGTYSTAAEAAAAKAITNVSSLLNGCDPANGNEDKCATQFIKDFGARAFRRPLTTDEEALFTDVYKAGKEESFAAGLRSVIEAALQSPSFLYLVEAGKADANGLKKLTGYEVATRLSYLLTGSMPDSALFQAARDGKLDTAAGVKTAASSLLSSPKFVAQAARFHVELLGVDALSDSTAVTKTAGKYPQFNDAMRTALMDEPRKFVEYVLTKGSGSIEELMSGKYVFPSGPLATLYGSQVKADADGRATVSDGTRSGLLTLAGTQAVHPKIPSPRAAVNRGHMVRRDFLCDEVPPPNVKVDFSLPPGADKMTAQELLRAHQANPTCKGCHMLMDSIGFGFENYDQVGAWRTKDDAGNAIVSSGELANVDGGGTFAGPAEMADKLSKSPQVRTCMSTQWFRFALGREPAEADACTTELVKQALSAGKGNLKDGLTTLVTSDSFRMIGGQ